MNGPIINKLGIQLIAFSIIVFLVVVLFTISLARPGIFRTLWNRLCEAGIWLHNHMQNLWKSQETPQKQQNNSVVHAAHIQTTNDTTQQPSNTNSSTTEPTLVRTGTEFPRHLDTRSRPPGPARSGSLGPGLPVQHPQPLPPIREADERSERSATSSVLESHVAQENPECN